ncbi:hypothetical protein ACFLT1_09385 [Bacteroidota bacterium]
MEKELHPERCLAHTALCSHAGTDQIVTDIQQSGLKGLLIAGCGKGTKDEAFRFSNDLPVERVNLRELVAWSMEPGAEDTLMAAEDYIRMGYAGLKLLSEIEPFLLEKVSHRMRMVV